MCIPLQCYALSKGGSLYITENIVQLIFTLMWSHNVKTCPKLATWLYSAYGMRIAGHEKSVLCGRVLY